MMQFNLFAAPTEIPAAHPWERAPIGAALPKPVPDSVLYARTGPGRLLAWFYSPKVDGTIFRTSAGGFAATVTTDAGEEEFVSSRSEGFPAALAWMRGAIGRAMGVS